MTELFFQTGVRDVYIATDSLANIADFSQSEYACGFRVHSIMQVKRVGGTDRYSPHATEELLIDFKLLCDSEIILGTASSSISRQTYYRRTVSHPLVADSTFTLDIPFRFKPTYVKTHYRIIDKGYILQALPSVDDLEWSHLEHYTNFTQVEGRTRDERFSSSSAGFEKLEMDQNGVIAYVPTFAIRKRCPTF